MQNKIFTILSTWEMVEHLPGITIPTHIFKREHLYGTFLFAIHDVFKIVFVDILHRLIPFCTFLNFTLISELNTYKRQTLHTQ